MDVELLEVTAETVPVLERLWQLYRHDLSEFRDSWPGDDGRFTSARLQEYVDQPDHACSLIRADGQLAGFVLIRQNVDGLRTLGEFFVVRRARRLGVGHAAATTVLQRVPGRWQIAFQEDNPTAARFWRRLATEVGTDVQEELRAVPGKPDATPDVWLMFTVPL